MHTRSNTGPSLRDLARGEDRIVGVHAPAIVRATFDRIARADVLVLLVVLVALVGAWVFLEIADEVSEGETQRLDVWVVRSVRRPADLALPIGPRWLEDDVRDLTSLGGRSVLLLVTASVVLYLWLVRTFHAMWLVLGAAVGGQLLTALLKAAFARPRPDVVPHLAPVNFSSFPSGHSMSAAVVYLTLGLLLARLTDRTRLRIYFLTLATFVTFLVGISRVYLGVHYPTDVLAGWAAGAVWAASCWLLAGYLQRRGAIETHTDGIIPTAAPRGVALIDGRSAGDAPAS
jgi:undecaprenyl-diphosphatase